MTIKNGALRIAVPYNECACLLPYFLHCHRLLLLRLYDSMPPRDCTVQQALSLERPKSSSGALAGSLGASLCSEDANAKGDAFHKRHLDYQFVLQTRQHPGEAFHSTLLNSLLNETNKSVWRQVAVATVWSRVQFARRLRGTQVSTLVASNQRHANSHLAQRQYSSQFLCVLIY